MGKNLEDLQGHKIRKWKEEVYHQMEVQLV